ncbi:MAG: C4-dicarboxylate ABC transporter substrate-binding protein [bacterium]|nr:C4-dicarboxylate ABC transporter substrate-binding protein [bacterium]
MKRGYMSAVIAGSLSLVLAGEAAATEWDVSLWGKRRAFTEHVEKLAELVSAKTDGGFTLNLSYGGLSKNKENLDGISIGAFEMAQFCAGYHYDKNPSITVLELPFLGVSSLEQEVKVSRAVYGHPAVVADMARWNATLLMPSPLPQYNIAGVGEAPRTLKDFEGLAVRATGGIGKAMKAIGVVKAVAFAPHAHMSFGTVESATWWTTNLNPGTVNCPVVVNTDALNALSETEREALLGSVDEALAHYISYYNDQTMAEWGPTLEAKGIETITFTDDELAAFRETVAGPAATAWVEENTERGLPAAELLDLVTDMVAGD